MAANQGTGSGVVLIVHRDELLRALMEQVLGDEGYGVRTIPPEHIERTGMWTTSEPVRAVLLDMYADGPALAAGIRTVVGDHVPIVACTTRLDHPALISIGAAAVMTLPFDVDDLVATVGRVTPNSVLPAP